MSIVGTQITDVLTDQLGISLYLSTAVFAGLLAVNFAPSLTWQPDDNTSFTLLPRYQRTLSDGVGGFLPSQGTLYPNPNGQIPRDVNPGEPGYDHYWKTDESIGYAFTHRFNEVWSFRQDLRLQNEKVDHRSIGSLGLQDDLRTLNRYNYPLVDHANVFAVDNQVEAKFDQGSVQHNVLMGVDYLHSHNDYKSGFGSAPTIDIFNPVYGQPIAPAPYTFHTNSLLEQRRTALVEYCIGQVKTGLPPEISPSCM